MDLKKKYLMAFSWKITNKILLAYLGAKVVDQSITKSALISKIIGSNYDGNFVVIIDKDSNTYTFKELVDKGFRYINLVFEDIIKKDDVSFFKEVSKYDKVILESQGDERLRKLAFELLNFRFSCINLKKSDIDDIISIVLPESDDIAEDNIEDEESSEVKKGYEIKKTYYFLKYDFEFTIFNIVNDIVKRYISLFMLQDLYKDLFNIMESIEKEQLEKLSYKRVIAEVNEKDLKETETMFEILCNEFNKYDFVANKFFKNHMSIFQSMFNYKNIKEQCKENCSLCIDSVYCFEKFIKTKVIWILKTIIEWNIFYSKEEDAFLIYCYRDVIKDESFNGLRYKKIKNID